jgi:hypothetical protein
MKVPTMPDISRIEPHFSYSWNIMEAPAFVRFTGLVHFENCMELVTVGGITNPPNALGVWVSRNTTVSIRNPDL